MIATAVSRREGKESGLKIQIRFYGKVSIRQASHRLYVHIGKAEEENIRVFVQDSCISDDDLYRSFGLSFYDARRVHGSDLLLP